MTNSCVNPDYPDMAELSDRISRREGTLTTRVNGSHVHVTASLRRWWSLAVNWTPTDRQIRRLGELLRRTTNICDFWLKALVIAAAFYFAGQVIWAFLPGHAVDRVLGGLR